MNQVNFSGKLGANPEKRTTTGGRTVTNFRIAVRDNLGKDDDPLWVRVVAWEKLGDVCAQYLEKGREVLVTGRLQMREYEKEGQTKLSVEVVASNVEFFGRNPQSGQRKTEPEQDIFSTP